MFPPLERRLSNESYGTMGGWYTDIARVILILLEQDVDANDKKDSET